MPRQTTKLFAILAAGLAFSALPGCGNYQAAPPQADDYNYQPNAAVKTTPASDDTPAPVESNGADPLIGAGNPLAKQADPLTGDQKQDPAFAADTKSDPLVDSGKTQGWYWINGSIPMGIFSISVNGIPIGRYSVHIDKEITTFCHPGMNTLTFTYDAGSSAQAHLKILNGHAPKGSPPVALYDCNPPPITYDSSPDAPGISAPTAPTLQSDPSSTSTQIGPITDTQTFMAE